MFGGGRLRHTVRRIGLLTVAEFKSGGHIFIGARLVKH